MPVFTAVRRCSHGFPRRTSSCPIWFPAAYRPFGERAAGLFENQVVEFECEVGRGSDLLVHRHLNAQGDWSEGDFVAVNQLNPLTMSAARTAARDAHAIHVSAVSAAQIVNADARRVDLQHAVMPRNH